MKKENIKPALIVASVITDLLIMFACIEAGCFLPCALGFAWLAAVSWANR